MSLAGEGRNGNVRTVVAWLPTCANLLTNKYFTSKSLFLKDLAISVAKVLISKDRARGGGGYPQAGLAQKAKIHSAWAPPDFLGDLGVSAANKPLCLNILPLTLWGSRFSQENRRKILILMDRLEGGARIRGTERRIPDKLKTGAATSRWNLCGKSSSGIHQAFGPFWRSNRVQVRVGGRNIISHDEFALLKTSGAPLHRAGG